jgi:hypothetical protein
MTNEELEEVILSLKAAGVAMPEFKILPDGSYLLYTNGQKIGDITVHSPEPRSTIG